MISFGFLIIKVYSLVNYHEKEKERNRETVKGERFKKKSVKGRKIQQSKSNSL